MDGPRVLTVHGPDYPAAFDAAVFVAKSHGLRPVVMDRGTGIIETHPRSSGSVLEPWRVDNRSLGQALGNTVNFERRRMRVEFVPADLNFPAPNPDQPVQSAALPGSDRAESRFDLIAYDGPVEIRAWVYVEREFRPNQQVGTWTQRQTRYADDPLDRQDAEDTTTEIAGTWTPVGRDEAYERTVMAEIRKRLLEPPAVATAPERTPERTPEPAPTLAPEPAPSPSTAPTSPRPG